MKVLDLKCSHEHRFEGWFASTEEFESQLARKLVACPVCSTTEISRTPSAPRLNLSSNRSDSGASPPESTSGGDHALQARALQFMREVLENTENVGERFAEEARRIHYDEAQARNIRGVATREDVHALIEEGIDVMPLSVPAALKEPLQ